MNRTREMDYRKINFERELDRGKESYEEVLGQWWHSRSRTSSHAYAYRSIVEYASRFLPRRPRLIVDYASGAGNVLSRLYLRFPHTRLVGVDGSAYMLDLARERLRHIDSHWPERVELIRRELPDFSLLRGQADVVFFVFPNIVPDPEDTDCYDEHGYMHEEDTEVADYLSRAREPDPEEETVTEDAETLYDQLLTDKVLSRNLHSMLRPGGLCVRADYANAPRGELTRLVRQRMAFQEGSLGASINGFRPEKIFRLVRSVYRRSRVVEDVYHQTRDESDRKGGYLISILKRL